MSKVVNCPGPVVYGIDNDNLEPPGLEKGLTSKEWERWEKYNNKRNR